MRDNYFFIIMPLRGGTSSGKRPENNFEKFADRKWNFENFSKVDYFGISDIWKMTPKPQDMQVRDSSQAKLNRLKAELKFMLNEITSYPIYIF